MKKIYALFMTLCLVLSATAAPLAGTVKGSYPLNTKVVTSAKQLSLEASMQKAPAATQGMQYDATEGELIRYYNESDALSIDTTYASEGQLSIRIVASDNSDLLSLVLFAINHLNYHITTLEEVQRSKNLTFRIQHSVE